VIDLDDLKFLYAHDKEKYNRKCLEEIFELGQAYAHFLEGKVEAYQVIEEIADMRLQTDKMLANLIGFDKDRFISQHIQLGREKDAKEQYLKQIIVGVRNDGLHKD
jgi:hypothetical protein